MSCLDSSLYLLATPFTSPYVNSGVGGLYDGECEGYSGESLISSGFTSPSPPIESFPTSEFTHSTVLSRSPLGSLPSVSEVSTWSTRWPGWPESVESGRYSLPVLYSSSLSESEFESIKSSSGSSGTSQPSPPTSTTTTSSECLSGRLGKDVYLCFNAF